RRGHDGGIVGGLHGPAYGGADPAAYGQEQRHSHRTYASVSAPAAPEHAIAPALLPRDTVPRRGWTKDRNREQMRQTGEGECADRHENAGRGKLGRMPRANK